MIKDLLSIELQTSNMEKLRKTIFILEIMGRKILLQIMLKMMKNKISYKRLMRLQLN